MFYIKDLKFNNFRCFKSQSFAFRPNINILVGDNGSGKTTIVEGISYLCLGKSFKNAKDKDVLRFNEDYFNIISNIYEESEEKLIISYDGKQKKIKSKEFVYKTLSEHVGKYKLISFCPDDLDIIKGSPSNRRSLLDVFISQYDNKYLKALVEYKKILKIRNEFLKSIENNTFDKIMFDVITSKLIETGEVIIKLREKYIGVLNERIKEVSKLLINDNKTVEITYLSDVNRENYKETIISSQKIDILSKTTTRGPQKDDLLIKYDNNDASAFASQGQIRVSVLAIKLAMFELFSYINSNVIMILDDVFSELDTKRQIYLMEYIKKVGQVFITTTEINKLPSNLINESNVIEIKEGESNVWYERKH